MKNIAIIPARGGSKRIPRKNIKNFLGKPIISYSIEAAMYADIFQEIMVSTDDAQIADIAKKHGTKVPFLRSAATSTDTATTVAVLLEVIAEYEKHGIKFDNLCCIYPCAPFVTPKKLITAMDMFKNNPKANSLIPVVKFSYPPQRGLFVRGGNVQMVYPNNIDTRSQDLEPIYHDAGQFYITSIKSLKQNEQLFCEKTIPFILPETEVQDIDTPEDWQVAEAKYTAVFNN